MSIDLRSQVRNYADYLDSTLPVLEAEDAMRDLIGDPPVQPIQERLIRPAAAQRQSMARSPRRLRVALVAALVAVVVLGGFAWLTRSGPQPDSTDQPTTSVAPTTTSVTAVLDGEAIPLQVVSRGAVTSSAGAVTWTVLEGDPASMPNDIVFAGAGYASISGDGQLLSSSDAVEWQRIAVPIRGTLQSIEVLQEKYVLEVVTEDEEREFWESSDLASWVSFDRAMPAGATPAVSGLGVQTEIRIGAAVSSNEATLTEWDSRVWIDWREIAIRADASLEDRVDDFDFIAGEVDLLSGTAVLTGRNDERVNRTAGEPLTQLDVLVGGTEDDWTLELAASSSGEVMGTIAGSLPGLSTEEAIETLGWPWGYATSGWALSTDATVELVEYPWPDHDNEVHLAGSDEGFTAVRRVGDNATPFRMEVWESADGRAWQMTGLASSPTSGDPNSFARRDGVMMVSFGHTDDVSRYGILRSEDGANWDPPSVPPVPTGRNFVDGDGNIHFNATGDVFALPSGWAWLSGTDTDFALWTSPDGDVWQQVDSSDIADPIWAQLNEDQGGGGSQWASGDVIFIRQDLEDNGSATLWAIEVGRQ